MLAIKTQIRAPVPLSVGAEVDPERVAAASYTWVRARECPGVGGAAERRRQNGVGGGGIEKVLDLLELELEAVAVLLRLWVWVRVPASEDADVVVVLVLVHVVRIDPACRRQVLQRRSRFKGSGAYSICTGFGWINFWVIFAAEDAI
ncbi:hypothetical protein GALMADRAFT_216979 [Galerina marginata CBS 339.88]|uniref:Uncharacterized protein n=1 Tax=Galerina marginata (strain CBS 339.88) TaxID=685588 RepID=A0A067SFU9_GALM3|nr:hypothetical protein GALMADRAFT_216979 [Galerina marginata CBS 339.88]